VSATPQPNAPAPPTGLAATPGNGQVSLVWNASPGATSYRVKRANVSGGPYSVVASLLPSTSYTDTTVTNGTTYYYVVSAVNSGGESGNSSEVSARPQGSAPAPPTNLSANSPKRGTIALQWVQSTTPGVTNNKIYRRTSGGSYPPTPVATISPTTSYRNNGLARQTTYCYVVTATTAGGQSASSNEACATTR